MKDYMMALHQRFCKEPECRVIKQQIREVEYDLRQALDQRGQEQLLKLALGISAELAPSYSFDDDEEQRACQALQRRRGE